MAITIDTRITRQRRSRGLLIDAAQSIDLSQPRVGSEVLNTERWMEGVSFPSQPCRDPILDDIIVCEDDTLVDGGLGCDTWITQYPFEVNDVITSSTLNMTAAQIQDMLEVQANETRSWFLAKGLTNVYTTNQKTLGSVATAPTDFNFGDAALTLTKGLQLVESELAKRLHDMAGLIHMSPSLLHQAVLKGQFQLEGGEWYTPTGHRVVADSGYRGMIAPTGQAQPAAGQTWIYGSGPIDYTLSPPRFTSGVVETLNFSKNDLRAWYWGAGILLFDTCPVTGVLVAHETA